MVTTKQLSKNINTVDLTGLYMGAGENLSTPHLNRNVYTVEHISDHKLEFSPLLMIRLMIVSVNW